MRKLIVVAGVVALVVGLQSAAYAPHSGCRAVQPGTPTCSYVAIGAHSAIVTVNGDWTVVGDKGTKLKGNGPVAGTLAVPATEGEKISVTIAGSAGVISSGTSSGHP